MRAHPAATDVIGAVVAVIRTCRPVRLVVIQTDACPVTGIRVGAVIIGGITAG